MPKIPASERKRLVTGPLHGQAYQVSRRELFTRDDLQRKLQTYPANRRKVWPPALEDVADDAEDQEKTSRKYGSKLLQEMHETMGPYLNKTCVRTANVDVESGAAGLRRSWGVSTPSPASSEIRLHVRKHDNDHSRPPTREYQKQLLQQIENHIADYADECVGCRQTSVFAMGMSSSADDHYHESNLFQV